MVPDNKGKNGSESPEEVVQNEQSQTVERPVNPEAPKDEPSHTETIPRETFRSSSDEVTKVVHRDVLKAQDPERKEPFPLDELTTAMFENPTVKKLLLWAKEIGSTGKTGSAHSISDAPTAEHLVEEIKAYAASGRNFTAVAEILFNGILKKTFKEEDVQFETKDFVGGLGSWLLSSLEMPTFAHLDVNDPARAEIIEKAKIEHGKKVEDAIRIIENFLHNDVFGTTYEERSKNLLSASQSQEIDKLIRSIVKDYLDGESRRHIISEQRAVQKEFDEKFEGFGKPKEQPADEAQEPAGDAGPQTQESPTGQQPDTGDTEVTPEPPVEPVRTGAALLEQAAAAQAAAEAAAQMAMLEKGLEQTNIRRANLKILLFRKDDNYEKETRLTVTRNGEPMDPSISEGQKLPIRIKGREQSTEQQVTIEIEGSKVVLINHGNGKMIDMDGGLAVHKVVLSTGRPVRVQIGEDRFQISVSGIERETIRPKAPLKSDSQPDIESKEAVVFNLPSVMTVDGDDNVIAAYPILDEKDRIVRVSSDPASDIVLPSSKGFRHITAELLFYPAVVYLKTGENTVLRFKNALNTFIPPKSPPVKFDPEDILILGPKEEAVYLKVTKEHPFTEADIKESLAQRLGKIAVILTQSAGDMQKIKEVEKLLKDYSATLSQFEEKLDIMSLNEATAGMYGQVYREKLEIGEQERLRMEAKRLEDEAKKLERQHYDADAGETAETPRPFKYPALVDKIESDRKGHKVLHVIFPGGLSVGRDKVNTLEPHAPMMGRDSKYAVQDNECTFVMDEGDKVRMVLEPRVVRNSKILVNGQIPGTRDGKTHELDMLRAPLQDDDVIEIGVDRYQLETNHEFTASTIKPYASQHLKEIMEVLVLYPDRGDQGDKRNAQLTLDYFLANGLVTEGEVNFLKVIFEREKVAKELTQEALRTLVKIREENESLENFVHNDGAVAGLPYDAASFRKAVELADAPAVRWDEMGWLLDEYRADLKRSATVRLYAYDKQLYSIREKMSEPNRLARLKAVVSKDAEEEYTQMQKGLQLGFRKILVEMISLIEMDLVGSEYTQQWVYSRITPDQYPQVEEITFAQRVDAKIHQGKNFDVRDVLGLLEQTKGKTYGEFLNYNDVAAETPMQDFILAEVKTLAEKLLHEANEGENISDNLNQIEEWIAAGLVTHEALGTKPEVLADLRDSEAYFEKCKKGTDALEGLVSSAEPKVEDILAFAKRLEAEEFTLTDEKEEEFKAYCRDALQAAVKKARIGHMTSYIAVLVSTAVRLKLAKPGEFGSTAEELDQLHEEAEVNSEVGEMGKMFEEARDADIHNLHPLLKLKSYLEDRQPVSLRREGKTGEHILDQLVNERLETMIREALEGEDAELLQMVLDDMRENKLAPQLQKAVSKALDEAIQGLAEEKLPLEQVRTLVQILRSLNLEDFIDEELGKIVDKYTAVIYELPDNVERLRKFGEELEAVGLYGGTV